MKSIAVTRFHANDSGPKLLRRFFSSNAKEKPKLNENWSSVIGLEIHAQISSKSKLFSGASTDFGNSINSCVSFFDCATPGTLPVLNRRCVEAGVLTAIALSCKVNEISLFDRKHYFYADLPAGYQITQQRQPLAVDGEIKFEVFTPGVHKEPYSKLSKLKQIQLEQDSGKSIHDEILKKSFIDLNRAGIPLMEFVFEPDLKDGEEAAALVKELMLMLERLHTCSCKMEEGALRVDANVSINRLNEPLGVRTEIKNISSVRAVASAINYEIKRQIKDRENGKEIVNETRSWDTISGKTVSMRHKEDKLDYRFMPEPNLPPLYIHVNENSENKYNLVDATLLKTQIPEMPQETRNKLEEEYGLSKPLILVLVNVPYLLEAFTYIAKADSNRSPESIAKILSYRVLGFIYENKLELNYCITIRDQIGEIVDLLDSKQMNLLTLPKVMKEMLDNPQYSPKQILEKNNWTQITNENVLKKLCQDILDQNPKLVKKHKNGNKKAYRQLVAIAPKVTNDRADMAQVDQILSEMLSK